jgi:hypothetical protein
MYYNKRMDCPFVLIVLLVIFYLYKNKIYYIQFKRQDNLDIGQIIAFFYDMCLSNGLKLGGGYVFVMC